MGHTIRINNTCESTDWKCITGNIGEIKSKKAIVKVLDSKPEKLELIIVDGGSKTGYYFAIHQPMIEAKGQYEIPLRKQNEDNVDPRDNEPPTNVTIGDGESI